MSNSCDDGHHLQARGDTRRSGILAPQADLRFRKIYASRGELTGRIRVILDWVPYISHQTAYASHTTTAPISSNTLIRRKGTIPLKSYIFDFGRASANRSCERALFGWTCITLTGLDDAVAQYLS